MPGGSATRSALVDGAEDASFEIFDPAQRRFSTLSVNTAQRNNAWSDLAKVWLGWRNLNLNPARLEAARQKLLDESRNQGLLIPTTALIAVEAASQWEILERKENQALDAHSSLEFEDQQQTSEPPWWVLLAGLLLYLFWRKRRAGC